MREQARLCQRFDVKLHTPARDSKVGLALGDLTALPINGLRHPPQGDANGWYLWRGEHLSTEADFFSPLHVHHLEVRLPEVLPYLALPPGYRFLIAHGHEDVWFDEELLRV